MSFTFREYAGGKITEPGAYTNVPMSVYHGQPTAGFSVSSSGLRTIFLQSLAHFWDTCPANPDRQETEETEAMILGRAAHHLLLGEEHFRKTFVERPKELFGKAWQSNRTECRDWLAARAVEGLTVLKPEQIEQIKGMARSLGQHPSVQGGILNGYVEVSMFWQDEETGIWLKARPDVIPTDSGNVSDLKCVADVSDDGIARGLGDRGYHQQAALVQEGMRKTPGIQIEMETFTLVYAEQKRPHCVRLDDVDHEEIAAGARENRAALRLLKRALEANYWPGPQSLYGEGGHVRRLPFAASRAARRVEAINQEFAA